jgi:hypothetical protein
MQMRSRILKGGAAATLLCSGFAYGQGADVVAGRLTGPARFGTIDGVTAYAIGTDSCNVGNVNLQWISSTNRHPVIGQSMFRLKDGRFEQIGLGWLKHGFFAINNSGLCGLTCTPSGTGAALGPGCWDPYGASLNGSQSGLGPRFEVNPTTGAFPYPFTAQGSTGNVLFKRIQVANADIQPSLNVGALYFGEGQYVAPDDAEAGNNNNNASYRRMTVGSFQNGGYNLSFTGSTEIGAPAIQAWQDFDPDVTLISIDVREDGRYWVGYKVTDNGDGTWSYEYAVQNLNSDIAGGSFSIPIGAGAIISNIGFKDIDYHSGEPYDNTDWTGQVEGGAVVWRSPQTFAQNPNSNALRWGTLYNFRFVANRPPESVTGVLGHFKPHPFQESEFPALGPIGANCPADINTATAGNPAAPGWGVPDGQVTPADFTAFVSFFQSGDLRADLNTATAGNPSAPGWGVPDGILSPADFTAFVVFYQEGCD